jgi:hypothetical protein
MSNLLQTQGGPDNPGGLSGCCRTRGSVAMAIEVRTATSCGMATQTTRRRRELSHPRSMAN